ncbi:unnamed protein product [Onchocerca ochengi]|uniref:Class I SAM-dependent methyltransferase n=1 Tax=Onchocerca ochengi TaxID=42157 RepID=A0A182EIR9_ONCOC|nr:unnamed protein product [Onchocerca ochengi]
MEMTDFLKQERNCLYDIIIFAEVLHYLHDFQVELELAKKSTSKKGVIICLVRRKEGEGHRIHPAEGLQRLIANHTEEERASTNERTRLRMTQMRAERRSARLENARLRAR